MRERVTDGEYHEQSSHYGRNIPVRTHAANNATTMKNLAITIVPLQDRLQIPGRPVSADIVLA